MGSDENEQLNEVLEKVDSLAEEISDIRKELEAVGSISEILEKVDNLTSQIEEIQSSLEPLGNMDDLSSSMTDIKGAIDEVKESQSLDDLNGKLDNLSESLSEINSAVQEVSESKENEVIIKKVDDILISVSELDIITKKLDDLQGYIAGLSGIEEKVEDLSNSFQETQEIVGIIVRQLDDIERKYNLSIEKISETADLVQKISEGAVALSTKVTDKKPAKNTEADTLPEPEKKTPISKASLPSTIDSLMGHLLNLVTPQTEAMEMAESLEEVRDQLTSMIQGHTPVLFQFGKRARELKSYPPTATLNENDIATLNKEIKSWASKLKEIAKNS